MSDLPRLSAIRQREQQDVETIEVPNRFVDMADRRTKALIRAAVNSPDALRVIARSCYLQGLEDGYAAKR